MESLIEDRQGTAVLPSDGNVLHKEARQNASAPKRNTRYQRLRWASRYWLGESPVNALNWRLNALWSV